MQTRGRFRAILAAVAAAGASGLLFGAGPDDLRGTAVPELPTPVAVFPLENLGGARAPAEAVGRRLVGRLAASGIALLDEDAVDAFLRRHRVRHTGGVSAELARALRTEEGAGSVLLASLDLYDPVDPPRFGLTARLVATGEDPRILWMDSFRSAGDEAPGILGLAEVTDVEILQDRVVERIARSLARYLRAGPHGAGEAGGAPARVEAARRFRPASFYRAPGAGTTAPGPRVAVLPFADESATRHAGEILNLQLVLWLVRAEEFEVIEPGVIRESLLTARLVQVEGLSVPQAELLRTMLRADLLLFGEVTQYLEAGPGWAEPEVDFWVRAIDTATRQVVWSSISQGRGDDGVFFFGMRRIPTAHGLASEMARALVGTILPRGGES